ncbi:metal dependent phosphohydrolase [Arcobacter nitrofigilis DSM 7299]|uniref:Metal dependent phosphohydrolase n=1 Tax=Arcobacter nitrofigilis (strain ATCC 33309 / DSM 7299 / CCUG 15893 / LMG 7604 / NCTC 12251 / CI) TaxID=572480 RepID=D5V056_ARCNC|nr:HD domain-containing phosphohydrolase [Arcobacter nitrofigilis]ADG93668.1 metal dependent phosphohydrolase [Arcobacter nitrofigilis DSM 7299]
MRVFDIEEKMICECSKALLLALRQKDEHTQMHSQRVVDISEELGLSIGFDKTQIKILRISAAFHDIGKIGIPDKILLKTTPFDDEEWKTMQSHTLKSEEIIKSMHLEDNGIVANAVRHHHEYYDGKGYPDKLKGEEISIYSRILSLADSYDAMASPRPYHDKRSHDEIMSILESENGIKHDPKLFKKFKVLIEKSKFKVD